MQVLIYAHTVTNRLQYICQFIFKEQLGLGFTITDNIEAFEKSSEAFKINYSANNLLNSAYFHLTNRNLLFEENIQQQQINCFPFADSKAFFATEDGDFPFDVFAASFYLISRYEEYLPHQKDMYGRFAHENSIAFKEGFLQLPLVNIWIKEFVKALLQKFPGFSIQLPEFEYQPTYDIDIAYAYKHKGFLRNIGGLIKSGSTERLKVLLGKRSDPFDTYDFLNELHTKYSLHPTYFFLLAKKTSKYDKNNSPYSEAMKQLIASHADKYKTGIHPSWRSHENTELMSEEKELLEKITGNNVTVSRQHYIKMDMPETYERLIASGILEDYSMGYGSINGFRASVASSFYWFNLSENEATSLNLFPFCYMDANSFFEQKFSTQEAFEELKHYYSICKKYHGCFVSIFHNNILGTQEQFKGWRSMYGAFLESIVTSPLPK